MRTYGRVKTNAGSQLDGVAGTLLGDPVKLKVHGLRSRRLRHDLLGDIVSFPGLD